MGRRTTLADAAGLAAVPALLVAVHALGSDATRETLAFSHADPRLLAAWTSALVHHGEGHLLRNVLGYVVAVVPAYVVARHRDRRRTFWRTYAAILVLTPPVVSAVSLRVLAAQGFPPVTERGFSAVVGAFAGALLVEPVGLVGERWGRLRALKVAPVVVLLALGVALFAVDSAPSPIAAGLLSVGLVLAVADALPERTLVVRPRKLVGRTTDADRRSLALAAYALCSALYLVAGLVQFGAVDGTFVNVYAHGAGILAGAAVRVGTGGVLTP